MKFSSLKLSKSHLVQTCDACGSDDRVARNHHYKGALCAPCAARIEEMRRTIHNADADADADAPLVRVTARRFPRRGAVQFAGDLREKQGKALARAMRAALREFQANPSDATHAVMVRQMDAWRAFKGDE